MSKLPLARRLAAAALLVTASASWAAADPATGTLTAQGQTLTFTGGPLRGVNVIGTSGQTVCVGGVMCDTYSLIVNHALPSNSKVRISVGWTNGLPDNPAASDDIDIYLVNAAGAVVAQSPTGAMPEVMTAESLPNGTYQVQIVPFAANVPSYTGSVEHLGAAAGGGSGGGGGGEPEPAGVPRVIVADIDSAINLYHDFFYQGGPNYGSKEPSAVTPAVLAELGVKPENHIKLTRGSNINDNLTADAAIWDSLQRGELYWFVGTNVIAVSYAAAVQPVLKPTATKSPHGAGTASAVLRANPEAVVLFIETEGDLANDQSHDLAFLHPAVDIMTTSYGISVPIPGVGSSGIFPPELGNFHNSYQAVVDLGKLHFSSGGNQPGFTPGRAGAGPWWSIGVSGTEEDTSNGRTTTSGNFPDFVSDFTQPLVTCMMCTTGLADYGGTSFSTPRAAGVASKVLLEARRKLNHLGGIRTVAGKKIMVSRPTNPISNWLLRRALEQGAYLPQTDTYNPTSAVLDDLGAQPYNPAAPWVQTAWGDLTSEPRKGVVEAALTHLDLAFRPRTKAAGYCQFQTTIIQERKVYWDQLAASVPNFGVFGDDPPGAPDQDPFMYCASGLPTPFPAANDTGGNFNASGDADDDGINNGADNCPEAHNPNQANGDGDVYGDVCDTPLPDTDGDGIADISDNCPSTPNANQKDTGGDGVGDACETAPVSSAQPGSGTVEVASFNGSSGPVTTPVVCLNPCGSGTDGFASFEFRYQLPSGKRYQQIEFLLNSTPGTQYSFRVYGPEGTLIGRQGSEPLPAGTMAATTGQIVASGSEAVSDGSLSFVVTDPKPGLYMVRVKESLAAGNQPFTLKVKVSCSAQGCASTIPVARLAADRLTGLAPLTVNFDARGSSDLDGTLVEYRYDFGDGNTAKVAQSQVSHTYAEAGNYTATVQVLDNDQQLSGVSEDVAIQATQDDGSGGTITVALSASPDTGDITDAPLEVTFTADAEDNTPNGGTLSYVFYYGDGTHSQRQTQPTSTHLYDKAGTYTAYVNVINEKARFARAVTTVRTTTTVTVDPNQDVVAALAFEVNGNTVTFDASGTAGPEGMIYEFDFGDGTPKRRGTAANVVHSYLEERSYTVTLKVTDAEDASNFDEATALVTIASNQATTAQLTVSPSRPGIGDTVTFDARASIAAEGRSIVSYTFDFGDQTSVTRTTSAFGADAGLVTHVYRAAGEYKPSVTVVDSAQTASVSKALLRVSEPAVTTPPPAKKKSGGALPLLTLLPLFLMALRRRRA